MSNTCTNDNLITQSRKNVKLSLSLSHDQSYNNKNHNYFHLTAYQFIIKEQEDNYCQNRDIIGNNKKG